MKAIIPESKLIKVLHTYLNLSFEGFDNCDYDWANFNCGMGVCCIKKYVYKFFHYNKDMKKGWGNKKRFCDLDNIYLYGI